MGRRPTSSLKVRAAVLEYDSAGRAPARPRLWLALIAVGVLARFALSAASLGTNDAAAWIHFGDEIRHDGLLRTYQFDPDFNHPPIPGLWAAAASTLAGDGGSVFSNLVFTNVFRLPSILADCAAIWLLFVIWRRRVGAGRAPAVSALFALSLCAILVSAFHCNTDSIYVMLCLLAVYLIEDRRAPFWGGLALGVAINVKLIPVLLILPLLLSFRRWQDAAKFVAGLALWALPFVPLLVLIPHSFASHALEYNSRLDRWGVNFFLLGGQDQTAYHRGAAAETYYAWARYAMLGLLVAWSIAAGWLRRWDRYEIAAITLSLFLIFAPGFGVQYTILPGLLLFAVRPTLAIIYGLVAGAFLFGVYFFWWAHGAPDFGVQPFAWPIFSQFQGFFPDPAAWIGVIAWALLIYYAATSLLGARPKGSTRPASA